MPSAIPESETSTSVTAATSPSNAQSSHARRASLKVLSRNINQVVLGNLVFSTWYYSPYPDSVILGEGHASTNPHAGSHSRQGHESTTGGHDKGSTNKANGRVETAAGPGSMSCQRLHVCPYCFRYTPKAGDYVQHLRLHNVTYDPHSASHGSGDDAHQVKTEDESDSDDDEEDTSTWPVPATAVKVYEWEGYAVWDVDGEREKLYCQNLSLFGKLFLEQKSVFFDTGGFHYFVLTYTPPPRTPVKEEKETTSRKGSTTTRNRRRTSSNSKKNDEADEFSDASAPMPPDINLRTRVLGFFSKENLSWDANNLACILVFPPYQHRNLGQLLMSVSYKLSGWEWEDSIIGGPEKPLSAMGRRSYLRFWSERVARFMMGQTADADGRRVLTNLRKRKKAGYSKEEMTVREIGDRTGMLAEDVVAALQEMGVLELVPPKKKKRKSDGDDQGEEPVMSSMVVHRHRVLEWVRRQGVDLVSPVKEEGFLGEWALSDVDQGTGDEDEAGEEESE